jgi:ABC-type polysaccharide/polyol phosphate transport system ATPase subunit
LSPVIQFDHVSKKYLLGHGRPRSFQEVFVQRQLRGKRKDFWAVHDVSFTIEPGEQVALLGANGSGKSTILKLISRVISPTSGTITTQGRVAGLLELGTGFHPDLTGRENIFLNGSILGLSRRDIQRQLDAIIDFADIGPFMDVQVRSYSSGMVVRLGFAVTTLLQPDILLIDEVLAVGDQNFQRKCIARLEDLQTQGVTLVFVSHGLAQIRELCDRAIWISQGELRADGEADLVSGEYSNAQLTIEKKLAVVGTSQNRFGTQQAEITRVELLRADGTTPVSFTAGEAFRLRLHYRTNERIEWPTFGLAFYRRDGVHVNGPNSVKDGYEVPYIEGTGSVDYVIDELPLNPGRYELTAAIYNHDSTVAIDHHHRLYPFEVSSRTGWNEEGVVHIAARWQHSADTPLAG